MFLNLTKRSPRGPFYTAGVADRCWFKTGLHFVTAPGFKAGSPCCPNPPVIHHFTMTCFAVQVLAPASVFVCVQVTSPSLQLGACSCACRATLISFASASNLTPVGSRRACRAPRLTKAACPADPTGYSRLARRRPAGPPPRPCGSGVVGARRDRSCPALHKGRPARILSQANVLSGLTRTHSVAGIGPGRCPCRHRLPRTSPNAGAGVRRR